MSLRHLCIRSFVRCVRLDPSEWLLMLALLPWSLARPALAAVPPVFGMELAPNVGVSAGPGHSTVCESFRSECGSQWRCGPSSCAVTDLGWTLQNGNLLKRTEDKAANAPSLVIQS